MSWIEETTPYCEISSPCRAIFAQTCQNHSASLKHEVTVTLSQLVVRIFCHACRSMCCFRFKKSFIFSFLSRWFIILFSGLLIRWTFPFILWKWKYRHVELIWNSCVFLQNISFFVIGFQRFISGKYTINFAIAIMDNSEFEWSRIFAFRDLEKYTILFLLQNFSIERLGFLMFGKFCSYLKNFYLSSHTINPKIIQTSFCQFKNPNPFSFNISKSLEQLSKSFQFKITTWKTWNSNSFNFFYSLSSFPFKQIIQTIIHKLYTQTIHLPNSKR